jgi:SAM-dependent methyltransferase
MTHDHHAPAGFAEMLDLDGEALHEYWTAALDFVSRAAPAGPERVLDLGAGSGVGTIALAQLFPAAEVTAVDVADELLDRIRGKAAHLGLTDRIRTLCADLDAEWPVTGQVDVVWASMSMHHLADPDRVLADLLSAIRPGGVVALAEFSEELRFLPDDLGFGRPGLEARCLAFVSHELAHELPHLGADWAPKLQAAGFGSVHEREFSIDVPGQSAAARRYAQLWLQRLSTGLADRLDADDRAALGRLTEEHDAESVLQRSDLRIRGTRTVTIGRNPGT